MLNEYRYTCITLVLELVKPPVVAETVFVFLCVCMDACMYTCITCMHTCTVGHVDNYIKCIILYMVLRTVTGIWFSEAKSIAESTHTNLTENCNCSEASRI